MVPQSYAYRRQKSRMQVNESGNAANPGGSFSQYFEIVPALSASLIDEVFRIRYRVYCEELHYEPPRNDMRESDEYDGQSLHLLIRRVDTREPVGCCRLVRVRGHDSQSFMPFERICASTLYRALVDPARLPHESVGEISRLSVLSGYRKRKGEQHYPVSLTGRDFGTPDRPRFPYILVGLYLGVIELARVHGIETLFVLTEPRLAVHLGRIGVGINAIGAPVDHHGLRIPSMMRTREIIAGLKPLFRPLYDRIAQAIAPAFAAAR